jgi:hypothetical protein
MQSAKSKKRMGGVSNASKILEGKYANFFAIGYNAFEFVLDFGQNYTETEDAELYTRVILAPAFARALHESLKDSIHSYEKQYGKIQNSILRKNKGINRKKNEKI